MKVVILREMICVIGMAKEEHGTRCLGLALHWVVFWLALGVHFRKG